MYLISRMEWTHNGHIRDFPNLCQKKSGTPPMFTENTENRYVGLRRQTANKKDVSKNGHDLSIAMWYAD